MEVSTQYFIDETIIKTLFFHVCLRNNMRSVFLNNVEITPTTMQIPLSFEEGQIVYYTDSDYEATESLVNEFLEKSGNANKRILMWEEDSTINLGTITIIDSIPEMHYISVQIGK